MADDFDMIVIGAGPGGYVCAIRAAQLGFKVACIDKRGVPGGTCLNVGCIPSKALLHASHLAQTMRGGQSMGISAGAIKVDIGRLQDYKKIGVEANVQGVQYLFKKNNIEEIVGVARLLSPTQIEVTPLNCANPPRPLTAKHIVIATGSEIAPLKGVAIDEDNIVSSTGALEFDEVPKHLVIVGAGIIGLELGSVWQRLGAQVSVIEYLDRIAPGLDSDIAKAFQRILAKQGINFRLGQKVVAAKSLKSSVKLEIESVHDSGTKTSLKADKVLVAIGRRAFTDDLGLEAVGITRDTQGRIDVDAHFKTNIDGIYAIGDVIKGAMLAHKAEDEGVALAEHLAGKPTHINYNTIPSVIYTAPEVAWVGANEDELKAQNIPYKVGKFPFTANGRAKVNHTTEGFVKILADATTDMILGAHIIGAGAGDMIGELVLAMEFSAAAEDVARTCHAHPTLSEALKEAALAVDSRALHI